MSNPTSGRGLRAMLATAALMVGGREAGAQTLPAYLFDVVYHNAPIIVAETYNAFGNPEAADHLLKVNFDCDDLGNNNALNIINRSPICDGGPSAYFSIAETGTTSSTGYYFIGYYFYHPRQPAGTIYVGSIAVGKSDAHEHDLEGVWFIVKKSPYTPYGTLYAAVSEAHGALIPYTRKDGGAPGVAAVEGPFGYLNFWYQPSTGVTRPVVMIRAATHGTYMAQDYTGQSVEERWLFSMGYGIDPLSPQVYGYYSSRIHSDSRAILYMPMNGGCAPSAGCYRLGPTVRDGTWYYGLQEVAASPIWIQRAAANVLFTGALVDIGAAKSGLSYFTPSPGNAVAANPMWNWLGGRGSYTNAYNGGNGHWYTFANDLTSGSNGNKWWPMSPTYGRLLTNPVVEAGSRFTGLTELDAPMVYNAYGTTWNTRPPLPGPPPPAPLSVSIVKPTLKLSLVTAEGDYTWTSTVSGGGGGPYTYLWERDYYASGIYYEVGQGPSLTQYLTCSDNGTYVALRLTVTSPTGSAVTSNGEINVNISPCPY